MLKLMKFLPADSEQILYQKYEKCKQGKWSVARYAKEFHWLNTRTRSNESDKYQIARFVDGLKEEIQEQMDLQPIGTLLEAISMA